MSNEQSGQNSPSEDAHGVESQLSAPSGPSLGWEDVRKEWLTCSMVLAAGFNKYSCENHEGCDGTCSNVRKGNAPLVDFTAQIASMLMPIAAPEPSRATAEDFPHDPI